MPRRTLPRMGSEQACAFCRVSINCLDSEFEVEADFHGEALKLHFHTRCHDAWQALLIPMVSK